MITDKQKEWLREIMTGKIKKKENQRKYNGYRIRIRKRIDHMLENFLWLAEHYPDYLRDLEYELNDETIPMKRRAKALLKALAMFENEVTILKLVNELYPEHTIEIVRRKKETYKKYKKTVVAAEPPSNVEEIHLP